MLVDLEIPDVDPTVVDRLERRAAQQGLSLNAFLLELLSRAAVAPLRSEVIDALRERDPALPEGAPSSVQAIREARDARDEQLLRGAIDPQDG